MSFTKNEPPYRTCGFSRHIFRTPAWAEFFQRCRRIDPPAPVIGNCQFPIEKTMIFLTVWLKSLISLRKNNDFLNVIFEIFDFHMKNQ